MDYRALGKRVRQQRQMAEITQEALAEKAGVSCSFIGHIERGEKKASIETLVCLCNAMGVSPMVLLQDSLDPSVVSAEGSNRLANDIIKVLREHNLNDVAGK
ncbi:MAG: helix-turn-helix transcriptional regulator [Clostridiales bacterium]|nr:helix-turn-helix transcriptional regulator [Clostridiales bacterium]